MLLPLLLAVSTFSGVVVVHHNTGVEEPVGGALVIIDDGYPRHRTQTATTQTEGTFVMRDVASGWYSISVASNFAALYGDIFIPPVAETRRVVLSDQGCAVWSGIVRDAESGGLLRRARFQVFGLDVYTDRHGYWSLNWGCDSHLNLHNTFFYNFSAPGYEWLSIMGGRAESFHPSPRLFDVNLHPAGAHRIAPRPDYNPPP
jgi:hypothetical protein